jgi:uncharacterized protein YihD (DUF1040 family)
MARDPKRIPKVIAVLQQAWERNPDLRLGQLISNATNAEDFFYYEDDRMTQLIETHYLRETSDYKPVKIKVFK